MENDKKFSNEMFGYSKSEVEDYIKSLKAEYESRLQAEHSDANRVRHHKTGCHGIPFDKPSLPPAPYPCHPFQPEQPHAESLRLPL